MYSVNGPPRGQNTTSDQSSYDLVFKDIIINYPPPQGLNNVSGQISKYTVSLNFEFDKLYKAELVVGSVHFGEGVIHEHYIPDTIKNSTIIVSIPQLNNNTLSIANQQNTNTNTTWYPSQPNQPPQPPQPSSGNNNSSYTNNMFCQIPDNYTPLGGQNGTAQYPSNTISTFIGGPPFSAVQFYNPPLTNISLLDISLLDVYGNNLFSPQLCTQPDGSAVSSEVTSFYFTIRFYYFVKRNNSTQFSVPLFNYAASGTIDSIFQNKSFN